MSAAKANSEEGVSLLLSNNADPDALVFVNKYGKGLSSKKDVDCEESTALTLSIEAENPELATTLMKVTNWPYLVGRWMLSKLLEQK